MQNQFSLFAEYNTWMNEKLYAAVSELSTEELMKDRRAFFGSVFGTLNHLLVADRIWLQRFAESTKPAALEWVRQLPKPNSLDETLIPDFPAMNEHRKRLDASIQDWIASLSPADLDGILRYKSIKGIAAAKPFRAVLQHFFNHQTHHRGQVTTLLSQLGKDVGATDLLVLIPNEGI